MWYLPESASQEDMSTPTEPAPVVNADAFAKPVETTTPHVAPLKTSLLSAQLAAQSAPAAAAASATVDTGSPSAESASLSRMIGAGRYALKQFLSSRTAYDLMPPSGKVVVLDKELRIKNAFEAMAEHGSSVIGCRCVV